MRIFVWALRLCIFLIFLALAVRNLQPVTLTLVADYNLEAPLIGMLLGGFLIGVVVCAISVSLLILRQRRDILRLSAELHAAQQTLKVSKATAADALSNPLMPPIA
jgi:putative membrane protein